MGNKSDLVNEKVVDAAAAQVTESLLNISYYWVVAVVVVLVVLVVLVVDEHTYIVYYVCCTQTDVG